MAPGGFINARAWNILILNQDKGCNGGGANEMDMNWTSLQCDIKTLDL